MSIEHPGFADPVHDAQAVFRAVLDAIAGPGRLMHVGQGLTPPPPLGRASAAVLLTLVDAQTPVCLAPCFAPAAEWIEFHCGARIGDETPAFMVADALPDFARLNGGTDEAPETSTTLVLQVAGLGEGVSYRLTGPGLLQPRMIRVSGLPAGFVAAWAANGALFPRGVDLFLCAGDRLAALPRTTCVTEG